ncbi:MAG: TetR/AcrR family transcriptional regulator [bacterium]|nr:TetR/AcrR family transcriptional regulator [bacterium]
MNDTDKKRMILLAASDCFARFGYEKTTMDDIGKLVGLNKSSLYYYYQNKESIFKEVIYIEREKYLNRIQKKVEKVKEDKEKILTYVVERYKFVEDAINMHDLTIETLRHIQPIFQEIYQFLMEKEIEFVREILVNTLKNNTAIPPFDTERAAKSIITVADAIKQKEAPCKDFRQLTDVKNSTIKEEIVFTISLILKGLHIE